MHGDVCWQQLDVLQRTFPGYRMFCQLVFATVEQMS